MVDALKRASAKTITVVQPFYGYARQDKKHRGREPISARLMADLFHTAGADRLIAVDGQGRLYGMDGPAWDRVLLQVVPDAGSPGERGAPRAAVHASPSRFSANRMPRSGTPH